MPENQETPKKGKGNKKQGVKTKPDSVRSRRAQKQAMTAVANRTEARVKAKPVTGKRRADWRLNHALVLDTFLRLLKTYQRKPTYEEIANQTSLTVQ